MVLDGHGESTRSGEAEAESKGGVARRPCRAGAPTTLASCVGPCARHGLAENLGSVIPSVSTWFTSLLPSSVPEPFPYET